MEESAFPVPELYVSPGLTKREWFAGMVLIGLLADGSYSLEYAKKSYEYADAMLSAGKDKQC